MYNEKINYNYLRNKKATNLREWHNKEFKKKDSLNVEIFENATILPLKKFEGDSLLFGRGGLVDKNGRYVEKSAIKNRVEFSYEFEIKERKEETVVYCGYLVNHWGHFLIEAVSRLWYFLEEDKSIDKYVFFIDFEETREIKGNYKEFFELLGIWNKIEIINKATQYKKVIVPDLGYKWLDYYSDQYKNIFNRIADNIKINSEWESKEKIFLTRSYLKKAQKVEFGLDMLDNYYIKNGYEVIAPENLTLSHLIYLIRNAKICASISGTLPHNMLFAKDNQKLVIIERNIINNEIQANINIIKQLYVTYIDENIAIYPVHIGHGPFIFSYSGLLEKYTKDNNYIPPKEKYCSNIYLKRCFKKYMKEYRAFYHYQWFMEDWEVPYTDYIREAYIDGLKYFEKYLNGDKPFKVSQYFRIHYIKQFIKKIIKKLKKENILWKN